MGKCPYGSIYTDKATYLGALKNPRLSFDVLPPVCAFCASMLISFQVSVKGKTHPIDVFSPNVKNAMSFNKAQERPKIATHIIGRSEESKKLNQLLDFTRSTH